MKDIKELNPHDFETTAVIEKNLSILFCRLSDLQNMCGKDFVITSGLRSEELQKELISQGKTNAKFSKHLSGNAADIQDLDGSLAKWILENIDAMKNIGLWFEDFSHTKGWTHAQIIAPMSGKRIFIP